MLLINFFKKASVIKNAVQRVLFLMLFLFSLSRRLILIGIAVTSLTAFAKTDSALTPFETVEFVTMQDLERRFDLAQQEIRVQKKRYQQLCWFGFAIIIPLLVYLLHNQFQLKRSQSYKEQQLSEALNKVMALKKIQDQQGHISNELYQNIGSQLTYIISSVDNLQYAFNIKDNELKLRLDYLSQFTSNTISDFRDTIWAMGKETIGLLDLKSRVSNYFSKIKHDSDKVHFSFLIDKSINQQYRFTSLQGWYIYRIIKEAIGNSLKHANAEIIEVQVNKIGSTLKITITDDGKGFDTTNTTDGNGLYAMRKFSEIIEAGLFIKSEPGLGTTIEIGIS